MPALPMVGARPPASLDQIEHLLAELVPLVDVATPERRGRPAMLAAGLVWGAMLTAILHGGSSMRGIWRTIATTGLWH
jgi:hypothetical protein